MYKVGKKCKKFGVFCDLKHSTDKD